jgi:hypothetical protein
LWRWRLLSAGKLVAAPLRTAMAALASLGLAGCDVGNGDELHDLRRDVRMAWGREHGAAAAAGVAGHARHVALAGAHRPAQWSHPHPHLADDRARTEVSRARVHAAEVAGLPGLVQGRAAGFDGDVPLPAREMLIAPDGRSPAVG